MTTRSFAPASSSAALVRGAAIELDDEESHYLVKVRRARVGQTIELLAAPSSLGPDEPASVWSATLRRVERRVVVELGERLVRPEPEPRVLVLGLPDSVAALEALTGASEAGASEIILVACARSQGRVPARARVERILQAAQRQCGRPRPPLLHGLDQTWPLARALDHRPDLPGWFASPSAVARAQVPVPGGLRLLVGPEGGLTDEEVEQAVAAGFESVSLGPWILRTPTAVVAVLTRAWSGSASARGE